MATESRYTEGTRFAEKFPNGGAWNKQVRPCEPELAAGRQRRADATLAVSGEDSGGNVSPRYQTRGRRLSGRGERAVVVTFCRASRQCPSSLDPWRIHSEPGACLRAARGCR